MLCSLVIASLFTGASSVEARLDPALQNITTYTFGESREPLSVVEDRVRESQGNSEERLKLEKQFAEILDSDATYECKEFICRQLRVIGTRESVPALKKLLEDEKLSDMARYALQQNPCPEAGKALRDCLRRTGGKVRIGIINSLGERRDKGCDDTFVRYIDNYAALLEKEQDDIEDEDAKKALIEARDTAVAAINALAKIGGEKAAAVLAKARYSSCPQVRKAAKDAILLWADGLHRSNQGNR
jgi:HEAT repeat protein